jgi:hypothetical protein
LFVESGDYGGYGGWSKRDGYGVYVKELEVVVVVIWFNNNGGLVVIVMMKRMPDGWRNNCGGGDKGDAARLLFASFCFFLCVSFCGI